MMMQKIFVFGSVFGLFLTPPLMSAGEAQTALPSLASANLARGTSSTFYSWMHTDITGAWASGYRGQGATITIVDDFRSGNFYRGNLGRGVQVQRHGDWTRQEAGMIASSAALASHDFTSARSVALASKGLNVLNLSYGMYARRGYSANQIGWSAQEASIISHAGLGKAVIAKAAGNDGVNVGAANAAGNVDYLNSALVGKQAAIFVGALERNGTVSQKAALASYSNKAGTDATVQARFLSVGVVGTQTGLYGTSFAAPIVAGYAAVLGSKFTSATPTQITNQLLATARQDTVLNYKASVHGRGEASISRAMAPRVIR